MYKYWMKIAYGLATKSPDTSNQNGAVIIDKNGWVIGQGYNHFPGGIKAVFEPREVKLKRIQHAERDAILSCWSQRRLVENATMICPWAACCDCALAIIGVKEIKTLVVHGRRMETTPIRWKNNIDYAHMMILEAGIEILVLEELIPEAPQIIVNSVLWQP